MRFTRQHHRQQDSQSAADGPRYGGERADQGASQQAGRGDFSKSIHLQAELCRLRNKPDADASQGSLRAPRGHCPIQAVKQDAADAGKQSEVDAVRARPDQARKPRYGVGRSNRAAGARRRIENTSIPRTRYRLERPREDENCVPAAVVRKRDEMDW